MTIGSCRHNSRGTIQPLPEPECCPDCSTWLDVVKFFSTEGAIQPQPRATPWVTVVQSNEALKGRFNRSVHDSHPGRCPGLVLSRPVGAEDCCDRPRRGLLHASFRSSVRPRQVLLHASFCSSVRPRRGLLHASFRSADRPRRDLLQKPIRCGFTLLEVVLALALSVAVMAVIGVAIQLHLNTLNRSTVDIERTQLARTLLHRIADDVRSAVRSEPFDDSGIMSVVGGTSVEDATKAAESAGLDAGALLGEAAGDSGSSKSGSSSGSSKTDDATDSDSAEGTTAPASTPGLYGSQYDLQVDVGRLPRPDELSAATMNGTVLPGDVRTVTYYLAAVNSGAGQTGLMRSELNRATALYQAETGDASAITENAETVADEVSVLEFRYFDGTQWLTDWDSTANDGLPMAVEISIVIDKQAVSPAAAVDSVSAKSTLTDFDPSSVYRLVVHLPNAQLPKAESATSEDSTDESSTPKDLGDTSGSSGSGGSSGGGSGPTSSGSKSGGSKTGSSKSGGK